ncbi:hypothetical protein [Psychrobacter sp. DM4]|uniref:hypothetical protein n=1 Tax=Psychrobacter sp. DM4 TaxID=3440637 RepID=UPI003F4F6BA6
MSQITLTLDEEVEAIVYQMANSENIAPDLWLSQFVKRQVKQHQGWSPEVKALAGSWADFPSLDEIHDTQGNDAERESL